LLLLGGLLLATRGLLQTAVLLLEFRYFLLQGGWIFFLEEAGSVLRKGIEPSRTRRSGTSALQSTTLPRSRALPHGAAGHSAALTAANPAHAHGHGRPDVVVCFAAACRLE